MKNTARYVALQSGKMYGTKAAFLGIPDGSYSSTVSSVRSTYMGKTFYIDNYHTMISANFNWTMDGTNIENYSMNIAPY